MDRTLRRSPCRWWCSTLLTAALTAALAAACNGDDSPSAATDTSTTRPATSPSTAEPLPATVPSEGGPPAGFPVQPDEVAWPTDTWEVAPWPDGVDLDAVARATDVALADGGAERVRAVVVVHGGAIVYERYSPNPDDGPDVVMPSYSIAKSITSALIGMLVGEGRLDLDEPAPVPEWHVAPDDPRRSITLEHMVHMATGMPWDDGLQEGSNLSVMLQQDDMAAYAASQQPTAPPGTAFAYNTGTTTLLARIVGESVGGGPDDTRAFIERVLLDPIGMHPVETDFDESGTWLGGFSADSTARAFAKFGLLYLRGGYWDGQQVIPSAWVDFSRTPSPASPEYGAHWWLDPLRPGVSYAIGLRGQVITVDPDHDLVIVQLSTVGGQLPFDHTEAILDAFAAETPADNGGGSTVRDSTE